MTLEAKKRLPEIVRERRARFIVAAVEVFWKLVVG